MVNCTFCRIIRKEIPAAILYEDEKVVAFKDIHPVAPIHFLIIPKEHVEDFYNLNETNNSGILSAAKWLIDHHRLMDKGYKLEINGGGAQIVGHVHFHLIAPVGAPVDD